MSKKKRVLLVEDIRSTRETFESSLELEGYDVTAVANLKDAIDAVNQRNFHVALVDIMLDGKKKTANRDGVEVIKRIHQLDEGTHVIPLTGQDSRTFVRDSFAELGVFDFIDKVQHIEVHGWEYAQKIIDLAISRSEIDDEPAWDDVLKGVLLPSEEPMFVDYVSKVTNGAPFDLLRRSLCSAIRQLQPMKGLNGAVQSFELVDDAVVGRFWSKAHGVGVKIIVRKPSKDPTPQEGIRQLFGRTKGKLELVVHVCEEAQRSDYVD